MQQIKIGACDWGLPGAGLYATQIASSVVLDALSLKIGLYENDYPITHPKMQKIYLQEQQKYGIAYCAIALNDFDNIPMHARKGTKAYDMAWLGSHNYTGYILLENYYDQLPLRTQAENPYDLLREDIKTLKKAIQ